MSKKNSDSMNKADLVDEIANKTGMTKKDVTAVIDTFVDVVVSTVKSGDVVTLTNFGSFVAASRKATTKFKPGTNQKINVPAKRVPKFKPGKGFKDAVEK